MKGKDNKVAINTEALDNNARNAGQTNPPQTTNNKKTNKQPGKFKRFFLRIGRMMKEAWSEFKKVTWASPAKVIASTGIVLAVVAVFFFVLLGFDSLLGFLLNLLIK